MQWKAENRTSILLLLVAALSALPLFLLSETLTANNNVESWLPANGADQLAYESFCNDFGREEMVIIGFPGYASDSPLINAVSERLARSEYLQDSLSPQNCGEQMLELGCDAQQLDDRLARIGLLSIKNDPAILCMLNSQGTQDRLAAVQSIRAELEYCNLQPEDYLLAGNPVIVAELDELGGHHTTKSYFLIGLGLCFGMLLLTLQNSKLTTTMMLMTGWAILAAQCSIILIVGHTNFILGALSVMVMIFSLMICVHLWHYYCDAKRNGQGIQQAAQAAFMPCCWATLTTAIGLLSLHFSGIQPVQSFGLCAAVGACLALIAGLFLLPAALDLVPQPASQHTNSHKQADLFAQWVIQWKRPIALVGTVTVFACGWGISSLSAKMEPLDFLPHNNKCATDLLTVSREYTGTDSIEAVADFRLQEMPFLHKLAIIQRVEKKLKAHPGVTDVLSAATFLPTEFGQETRDVANLLSKLNSEEGSNPFISADLRCWRLSVRVDPQTNISQLKRELEALPETMVAMSFTGITALVDQGQWTIFNGFWDSFASALIIISLMMMVAMRSIKFALLTMIPNVAPLMIVFGLMGWLGLSIDIGMMMTGSIALGIAVDGTFHLVTRFRRELDEGKSRALATHIALRHTALPIAQSAVISAIGMLALTLSPFGPTAQFGLLMSILLLVAVVGDLILLPAYLCMGEKSEPSETANKIYSFPATGTQTADATAG